MPNTIVRIRYGDPPNEGDPRPLSLRMRYPLWTLLGEPRLRMPYRMQVTGAVEGNYISPITNDPMTIEMDMALRQRRGTARRNVGNPVAVLNSLRNVQGRPLTVQWGAEIDYGDGWYLTGVDVGFRLPAQYPLDVGGSSPRDGGMVFDTIGVRLSFTADNPPMTAPILLESPDDPDAMDPFI